MHRRKKTNPQPLAKVEAVTHADAVRPNLPTPELASVAPIGALDNDKRIPYARRNRDLDPQLVWRGKDEQDETDLIAPAPPIYIEEKIHPKALINDLMRFSFDKRGEAGEPLQADIFADFNGLPEGADKTAFYQHDARWSNRMILGDSLHAMASLAELEGFRGNVQCIYIDPPYGIRFNSNFQWSTRRRDVRDGDRKAITREPEQVKAFRDTWRDGVHSYLTYLRDRLTAARDLLADSGSIFVQIGDDNVHRVRSIMDEVFGEDNFVSIVTVRKTTSEGSTLIGSTTDFILWYAKNREQTKFNPIYAARSEASESRYSRIGFYGEQYRLDNMTSSRTAGAGDVTSFVWRGREFKPGNGTFKTTEEGLNRLSLADRLHASERGTLNYKRLKNDFGMSVIGNLWSDISGAVQSRVDSKVYVVQTSTQLIERCILMTTDPGDLVLDPTCGSGTTAQVAEQWGRRWITIDTSRVALALARMRIMGARYPYYILRDSPEGQRKEAELRGQTPSDAPTYNNVRQGFVYQRVPHVTLRGIANNREIDIIWEEHQAALEPLRAELNAALGRSWEEWEVPQEAEVGWPEAARTAHAAWREGRAARQARIDASIARNAAPEYLYDKPYADGKRVRVAGQFTVETLSPHRSLVTQVDVNGRALRETGPGYRYQGQTIERDFAQTILNDLKVAGVRQARKEDAIRFISLDGLPGRYVCAEGRFMEGDEEWRCGIFIGPEFGTVSHEDLTAAAREAADTGFDLLIACAFSYDGRAVGMDDQLGRVRILRARMNADLHMSTALKATDKSNLFVVFGEPDIRVEKVDAPGDERERADGQEGEDGAEMFRVRVLGVDMYHPSTGRVENSEPEDIACWFVDTNYNEESFFVRQAYFLGANADPYKALKTSLRAEINEEAWESLRSDVSRPFPRPQSGRIAVKVINHLGDEVMKVVAFAPPRR